MFKRKIFKLLMEWKNRSNGSSALLVEGARRVGKTTAVEYFAKNEFKNYKLIDFSIASKLIIDTFNDLSNIEKFFERLFLALEIKPLPKGSLIIFDEVQFCPKARQAIKTLVADKRYFYIETGSLVSIKENVDDILIPSEEENITLNPLDYEEFLWACGLEYEAELIKEHFNKKIGFNPDIHRKLMQNFRTYVAIGGMPKVVDTYLKTKDYFQIDREKRNIVNLYEQYLKKIDNRFNTICSLIWKQMPFMLTKHSTRFILSSINERADSILLTKTLDKLIETKMINCVYKCSDPSGGLALSKDANSFKLYYADTGLFTSIVYMNNLNDLDNVYQRLILDNLHTNLGMLFENISSQALVSKGLEPYYYAWEDNKNGKIKKYEIDFLVYENGKTIPFEVKSRNVSNKSSLDEFRIKFAKKIGDNYIVSPRNFKKEDKLIYLPYYMLFAID